MLVIRPVEIGDVDQLLELAQQTQHGLTTLPRDRAILERRVRESLRGFEHMDDEEPRGQTYLFVLEEIHAKRLVGTSGVVSKVGGFQPFYAYRLEKDVHQSRQLNIHKEIQLLKLVREHDGPCEIGSLFLHPKYRRNGNGRLLSLARFMFMADFPLLFDIEVIAELRGVIDDRGHSAFWEAVGRHFFDLELPQADYLSVVDKQFIADLMPTHPIYVSLLPPEAQAVIGKVHDLTIGARRILESEGFMFSGMVDIFEAGPVMRCPRDEIRTVRDSHLAILADYAEDLPPHPLYVVSNARQDFRAALTPVAFESGRGLCLPQKVVKAIGVKRGDTVRFIVAKAETDSAIETTSILESR